MIPYDPTKLLLSLLDRSKKDIEEQGITEGNTFMFLFAIRELNKLHLFTRKERSQ